MALLLFCSVVLILNSLVLASLQGPPTFDKDVNLFGQRFVIVPQPQPEIDYYDAVAQGMDNDPPKRTDGVVDGSTFTEPVLSPPDFDTNKPIKVTQKHLDTKQLINSNQFNVQTPEEEVEVSSGEEPKFHLVDGETGPPSIQPPSIQQTRDLPRPPVASRFIQL